jgi:hypothetical protein
MRAPFQWATRAVIRAVVLWPPQCRGGLDTIEASLRWDLNYKKTNLLQAGAARLYACPQSSRIALSLHRHRHIRHL